MFDKNGCEIKTGDAYNDMFDYRRYCVDASGENEAAEKGRAIQETRLDITDTTTMTIDSIRRLSVGKTQREVSDAIGITLNNYARLERGEADVRKMGFENAMKLCEILRITPYELMNAGDNSRKAHEKE